MGFQEFMMRTMLKLPEGWLMKFSGGKPYQIGDRVMDPHMQFFMHGGRKNPPIESLGAEGAREASDGAIGMVAGQIEPGVTVKDTQIPGDSGHQIPIRIHTPAAQKPDAPLMVYYHMGGGVIGTYKWPDAICSMIANAACCPVVSVDYRKSPEHKFPAALNDCIAAYEWGLRNAASLGAPAGKASIGGDSMGGNFSAIIAQDMRRQQKPSPELQLLIYPAVDIPGEYASRTTHGETFSLTNDTMNWFMDQYLPEGHDRNDLLLSPGRDMDLAGLPPAVIATAGFDPLVDEGDAYAKRLDEAGVDTMHKRFDRLPHGFTGFTGASPGAEAACREIAGMVAAMYAKRNV